MGSCISKSKPKSSSPAPPAPPSLPLPPSKDHESCFVQDKLVIISSHSPPPSPSSASSSFPSTNTHVTSTTTTYLSSANSSITSCSSASSSISGSKDKSSSSSSSSSSASSYSNDYLWSCIKENPKLFINQATLDKPHVVPQNSSFNFHTRKTKPSPTKSTLSSSKKEKNQSINVHPTPQKRSRHQLITTTSSVPAGKMNSNLSATRYSSSPIRKSKGGNTDTRKGIPRINSPGRKKNWNHDDCHEELSIYTNTNNRNIKEAATTRPVIRPSSPVQPHNYMRNQDGLGLQKKKIITSTTTTTNHQHIYDDDDQQIDDIDNPLISLDCFIFL